VQDRLSELVHVPVHFERLAATVDDRDQYIDFTHPVKRPKNEHAGHITRITKWIDRYGDAALEVEAVPSSELRARVRKAIMRHISQEQIDAAHAQEERDYEVLLDLAHQYNGVDDDESAGD
jgi:hypothetical protein